MKEGATYMNKRFFHIGVMFLLIVSIIQSANISVHAKSIDDIEKELQQIDKEQMQLEEEKNSINREKKETSEQIKQNLNKQSSTQDELSQIDDSLSKTEKDIADKEDKIKTLNSEIENLTIKVTDIEDEINVLHNEIKQLNNDIIDLQKRLAKREDILRERLRSMQNGGGSIKYLEVLLGSKSFTDFIGRTTAVSTIMKQDKTMIEEHKEDKELLEDKRVSVEDKSEQLKDSKGELIANKSEIEDNKEKIETEKNQLVSLKQELDQQASEKERLLGQLQIEQEDLEEYEISLEDEQRIVASQAAALEQARQLEQKEKARLEQLAKEEAKREEERKKEEEREKEEEDQGDSGGGGDETSPPTDNKPPPATDGNKIFIKPTEGRYTSMYGMRWHPIHNAYRHHNGIDIANSPGTPIKAVATGVVIDARYMRGFGNTVIILHSINGQTYATLYAHMNGFSVSVNQVVQAGDQIGVMGSTGDSTGPHLHFEVHKGGFAGVGVNIVNPMNYIINP